MGGRTVDTVEVAALFYYFGLIIPTIVNYLSVIPSIRLGRICE